MTSRSPKPVSGIRVIRDDTEEEVGSIYIGALGGHARWTVVATGGVQIRSVHWQGFGTHAVANYIPNREETKTFEFSPTGTSNQWYWKRAGRFSVTISVRTNHETVLRMIVIRVIGPILVGYNAELAESRIKVLTDKRRNNTKTFQLHLGDLSSGISGFEWTGKVTSPADLDTDGEISVCQLVQVNRVKDFAKSGGQEIKRTTKYVLDRDVHYGISYKRPSNDFEASDEDFIRVKKNSSTTFYMDDSPMTTVWRQEIPAVQFEKVEVHDKFKAYLMYKPTGGIWVGLVELHWEWNAVVQCVQQKDGLKTWLASTTLSPKLCECEYGLPVWSENVEECLPEIE